MIEIPIKNEAPVYTIKIPLDGTVFRLRFEWNMRSGWYLGLQDAQQNVLMSPRKLTVSWPLLRYLKTEGRPLNELVLVDIAGAGAPPGRDDLGVRHRLFYDGE